MQRVFGSLCLCGFVFALGGDAPKAAPDRERFVGHWVLNDQASDQPIGLNGRGADDRGGGGRVGGGGRGGRMGGGGGRMGGGGGGFRGGGGGRVQADPAQIERMREVMAAARRAPRRLIVIAKEDALVATDELGDIQRLTPDGQKHKGIFGTVQVDRTTRWKGDDLVSEIDAGNGVKLVQTFKLLPETRQLSYSASLESARGGRQGRALTFVYDLTSDGR